MAIPVCMVATVVTTQIISNSYSAQLSTMHVAAHWSIAVAWLSSYSSLSKAVASGPASLSTCQNIILR